MKQVLSIYWQSPNYEWSCMHVDLNPALGHAVFLLNNILISSIQKDHHSLSSSSILCSGAILRGTFPCLAGTAEHSESSAEVKNSVSSFLPIWYGLFCLLAIFSFMVLTLTPPMSSYMVYIIIILKNQK